MNDYIGHPIYVGDEVVFIRTGYRELQGGKVVKIGKKKITIQVNGRPSEMRVRDPEDCIKEVVE